MYSGTQTVSTTDNGDGTLTQTTSYNNSAFNAITTGIAMLTGGAAAGLAGANAQAGTAAAQNEALNNTLHEEEEEFRKDTRSAAVPLGPKFGSSEAISENPETGAETVTETVDTGSLVAVLGNASPGAAANSKLVPFSLPNGTTIEGVAVAPSLAPFAPTPRYQITPTQAAQYLQQMGIPQNQIESFVSSFQGPIYVRNALPGETFGAYSGGPGNPASGQYLTPSTAGQTPGQVANTLALPPSNPATTLNAATINRPIPVLEGVVAPQTWNGVQSGGGWQVFVPGGARYGPNPPVTIGPKLN